MTWWTQLQAWLLGTSATSQDLELTFQPGSSRIRRVYLDNQRMTSELEALRKDLCALEENTDSAGATAASNDDATLLTNRKLRLELQLLQLELQSLGGESSDLSGDATLRRHCADARAPPSLGTPVATYEADTGPPPTTPVTRRSGDRSLTHNADQRAHLAPSLQPETVDREGALQAQSRGENEPLQHAAAEDSDADSLELEA